MLKDNYFIISFCDDLSNICKELKYKWRSIWRGERRTTEEDIMMTRDQSRRQLRHNLEI